MKHLEAEISHLNPMTQETNDLEMEFKNITEFIITSEKTKCIQQNIERECGRVNVP